MIAELDEKTATLFVLFQKHRATLEIMFDSGLFDSPLSQWKLSFNREKVLTDIKELERVAYKR